MQNSIQLSKIQMTIITEIKITILMIKSMEGMTMQTMMIIKWHLTHQHKKKKERRGRNNRSKEQSSGSASLE